MVDTSGLRPWQRFHIRLTLLYGVVVFAVLVTMSVMFYRYAADAQVTGVKDRLRDTAIAIAVGLTAEELSELHDPSMQDSPEQRALLAKLATVAAADPDISDIYVFRRGPTPDRFVIVADHVVRATAKAGKLGEEYVPGAHMRMLEGLERPTVEKEPYTDAWGTVVSGYAPVKDRNGYAVGIVGIDVQLASVDAMKARVRNLALVVFLGAVLALIVLARVVAVSVREPLYRIVEATSAITSGRPRIRASSDRKDEFGVVGRHFDTMASGLEERDFIKDTFGTYVSPEVVKRVIAERSGAVAGEQRDVVVLFADLRSFTTISEAMTPQDVVLLLNDYLERMSQAVVTNGGRIDKFIGDALMADWGSLEKVTDGETHALQAALEMQLALAELNRDRVARGEPVLRMGIGLHAGRVVAGSIGSQRKLEFTVIGDAVNVASRLEGLCKLYGVTIISSASAVAAAKTKPAHRRIDRAIVAGKSEPIELVEVLDAADPRVARIATYERGMVDLYAHRWDDAIAAFEEAGEGLEDGLVRFQIGRAIALRDLPDGGAGWDGIERRRK